MIGKNGDGLLFPSTSVLRSLEGEKKAYFLDKSTEVLSCEALLSLTSLGFLESNAAVRGSALAVRTTNFAGKVLATDAPNLIISSR